MAELTPEELQARAKALDINTRDLLTRDDRVLLILNAHLVVEKHLRSFLASKVPNPEALDAARLSFHQVFLLVKAFHQPDELEWLWKAILQLNKLRNELAHNLKPKDLGVKVRNFVNVTKPYIYTDNIEKKYELEFTLMILCAVVLDLRIKPPEL